MAKAKVIRGGWSWRGVVWQAGDVVEASDTQIEAWARDGYVEPLDEPTAPEPAADPVDPVPRKRGARR